MIEITDTAIEKISQLIEEEKDSNLMLRAFVSGGGCLGFQYGFTLDNDQQSDDWEFSINKYKLLVDAVSMNYLTGATIDFKEDIYGTHFTITNPNASTSCGCGNSFST